MSTGEAAYLLPIQRTQGSGCLFDETKMAEIMDMEVIDSVDDEVRDPSEILVSIKTPQDSRKVSVCGTGTVKQVLCTLLAHRG